ncbi:DUF4232 domain-containing protein [Streptomyces sp. MST-110588]|uniref:DUF4232 domain-containing protein n=1 Tax=Streptomyces sp. MST-110588 TaxID=2833628 RepID=UPI001F5DBBAC|nr:DUF4232 domain-containing protein [Streptomyces sp. MST-110588]UNO41049.1 DUF4232 domain-containing protein [Streptomyces sp. MST-110588]
MTARRRRSRRSATYAVLAVAMAGSLALTGCSGGSSSGSSSKSKSRTKSKSKSHSSSSSSTSKGKSGKRTGGGSAAAAGGGAVGSTRSRGARSCGPGIFRFTVYSYYPSDHVVIKATNRSSLTCLLYNHPVIRFGGAKNPLPVMKDSSLLGESVVTVAPKATAWASIPTATAAQKGSGPEHTYATIEFSGRDLDDEARGPQQRVDFPNARLAVGATQVTFWQRTLRQAEHYTKPKS